MRENHLGPPEGTLFQQKNVIYSIQLNELLNYFKPSHQNDESKGGRSLNPYDYDPC